jgi:hypothetical protein
MPNHFNKDEEEPIISMYVVTGERGINLTGCPRMHTANMMSNMTSNMTGQHQGNDTSNIISRAGRELGYKVESVICDI